MDEAPIEDSSRAGCLLRDGFVVDGEIRDMGDVKYLLSPQDLMAVELVPELIDAGVGCFKIEGRLKDGTPRDDGGDRRARGSRLERSRRRPRASVNERPAIGAHAGVRARTRRRARRIDARFFRGTEASASARPRAETPGRPPRRGRSSGRLRTDDARTGS